VSSLVALGVLLAIVAWLTAAATAVRFVSRIWLRHWVERRLRGASTAELYLERPLRLLVASGTGIALAVFAAGELLGAAYPSPTLPLVERVVAAALVVLVAGQLVPRALARRWATRLVPLLLPPLRLLDVVVAPVLLLARRAARLIRREPAKPPDPPARDGIEDLLREGELEGVGERDEIAIITGVVHFGDKTLGGVATPRAEVFAIDEAVPPAEMAQRIASSGYSRVPIYRGTLDHVAGMVHVFDVLKAGGAAIPPLRPVAYAPATKPCNEQLFEMLRARRHLAIVQDDGGRTLGIVTLEDLLEELVGDISDEHDEPLPQ
jgi:putative hemolysin